MNRLSFRMAGLDVVILSDDLDPFILPSEFTPFVLDQSVGSTPAAFFTVSHPCKSEADSVMAPVSWQSDLVRLRHLPDAPIFIEIFDATSADWRLAAMVAKDFSSGTLYRGIVRPDLPLHHPHDRLIILGMLAHLAGGVVHCSCVLDRGRALLFVGRSGVGKTTIARIWRDVGATILNDERNIIRIEDGVPLAGSSPWHGEENQVSPLHAPLAGVFFLRQAAENSVSECKPAEAVTSLFTSTLVPVFIPSGPALILQSWNALFERTPAHNLAFTPDHRVVDVCRDVISNGPTT